jgi:hypothetical protein
MVRNAFLDGADGRGVRRLPETPVVDKTEPAVDGGEGRALRDAHGEEYKAYRHKFSCRLSDEDFLLLRRLRFELDVDSTTLMHEMIRVCVREKGVDWSRFRGPLAED